MKLYFIRHAEPDYAIDSLTQKGWREAKLLAKRMSAVKMDEIYVSPLGRAKDTCNETLKCTGQTAETLSWLQEFYVPVEDPWGGRTHHPWDYFPANWTKCPDLYDRDAWVDSPLMSTGPVRERYDEVVQGLDGVLRAHGYDRCDRYYRVTNANEDTLVFFCHFGVTCVMLSHLCGVSAPVLWQQFFLAPSSVTLVCTEERVRGEACFRVKQFGDVSHLYIEGEPPSDAGFFMETWHEGGK